jgi:hypothetical protein
VQGIEIVSIRLEDFPVNLFRFCQSTCTVMVDCRFDWIAVYHGWMIIISAQVKTIPF